LIRLLLFILFCPFWLQAQTYKCTNYSLIDGLSQSEVLHICNSSDGRLWMATNGGGINIFDGTNFNPLTTFDGLSNNRVTCSFQDKAGTMWIGTIDGLNAYDGLNIKQYLFNDDHRPFVISDILETKVYGLLIASNKGIFQFKDDKLKPIDLNLKFKYLAFILESKNGDLWFGTDTKIYKHTKGNTQSFSTKNGLSNKRIMSGILLPNHQLLVTSYSGLTYILEGDQFNVYMPESNFQNKIISALHIDSKENLWMGTINHGIYKINLKQQTVTHLTQSDGLANDHIEAITQDKWQNIWIGTGGGGITKYHKVAFSQLDVSKGLPGNWIYSSLTRGAEIWLGAGDRGVCCYTDSSHTCFNSSNGFIDAKVRLLFKDRDNRIWLAPEGKGLWVYDSTFIKIESNLPRVKFDHIKAITQDNNGDFWVCEGGKGLIHFSLNDSTYKIKHINQVRKKDGLPSNYIYALHTDAVNRIWFGSKSNGAGYILSNTITKFTTQDNLATNTISMITEDQDGYIWLGGGDGISRIKAFAEPLTIEKIGYKDGLGGIPVYQVAIDSAGFLWAGTSNGATRFNLNNGVLDNPKHYGYNDGFIGLETNTNAISVSNDGKVFLGTGQGLMVYEGEVDSSFYPAPKLKINSINLFYAPIQEQFPNSITAWNTMRTDLILNHEQNNLSFNFHAVDMNNPDKVTYVWQLVGFDRSWTPPSNGTEATYSNLPSGTYRFLVKARNTEGTWSEEVSTKEFTILAPPPPFWQKTWFQITVGSILTLILFLIAVIWYTRQRRARERIQLEKDVVELEQKALRLQMNPHFIFNALNSIQSLISSQDAKKARYQLAKFSKLMRQILDNSRTQVISLAEEMDTLENYMTIEQFSSGNQFNYTIKISEDLEPEQLAIPPMMIQPFTENAIIHGMKHLKEQGNINVTFARENDCLVCRIEDNGIGRVAASKIKSQIEQKHKSAALIVTQERLDILHGSSTNKSLEIIDLYSDKKALGTEVVIRFPFMHLE